MNDNSYDKNQCINTYVDTKELLTIANLWVDLTVLQITGNIFEKIIHICNAFVH